MKVFVSSVIAGFGEFRDAAVEAIRVLGYDVIRAEDFGATASSPQAVCLHGVRQADVVVLVLGERYGALQASGLSATHEEYREAQECCQVLAFVSDVVSSDERQRAFVEEVQAWHGGVFTSPFSTPSQLAREVTRRLHALALELQQPGEGHSALLARATALVPQRDHSFRDAAVVTVVSAGPVQQLLRPSALEDKALASQLKKAAAYEFGVLDEDAETRVHLRDGVLVIEQDERGIALDPVGSIRVVQPAMVRESGRGFRMPALIVEDITERVATALRYSAWVLDQLDTTGRLRHVSPVAAIVNGGHWAWRTRQEHARNPNTGQMRMGGESGVSHLIPSSRPRPLLSQKAVEWAEDLTTLLRREMQ
jgi:hypothetical protein